MSGKAYFTLLFYVLSIVHIVRLMDSDVGSLPSDHDINQPKGGQAGSGSKVGTLPKLHNGRSTTTARRTTARRTTTSPHTTLPRLPTTNSTIAPQVGGSPSHSNDDLINSLTRQLASALQNIDHLHVLLAREAEERRQLQITLINRIITLESGRNNLDKLGPVVAFSAGVNRELRNLKRQETIVFEYVPTNIGAAYNPVTGQFRCPVSGLYHFSVTILSFPNEQISTELAVNGIKEIVTYSGSQWLRVSSQGCSGSNTFLVKLAEGDLVWVRVFEAEGENVSPWWSTFNGYLVRKI